MFSALGIQCIFGELAYSRQAALFYASHHCGTSLDTAYNHAEYICYNGDKPECINYGAGHHVDCANFASQALLTGFGGKDAAPLGVLRIQMLSVKMDIQRASLLLRNWFLLSRIASASNLFITSWLSLGIFFHIKHIVTL